jgi:hypothetical protein
MHFFVQAFVFVRVRWVGIGTETGEKRMAGLSAHVQSVQSVHNKTASQSSWQSSRDHFESFGRNRWPP